MTLRSSGDRILVATAVLLFASCCTAPSSPNVPGPVSARAAPAIGQQLAGLPLSFIENRGQIDGPVDYYVQGSDASVYLTPSGMTVALSDGELRSAVEMEPLGAQSVEAEGLGRAEGIVSYFKGPRSEWKTGLPTYSRVAYRDLWPGIDLVYSGDASSVKYSFLVAPGADPDQIRLAWSGATDVSLNDRGQLEVATDAGTFLDDAPVSYQHDGQDRTRVETAYDLSGDTYGFRLAGYDPLRPLVIDPVVLVYAGFIGGEGEDYGFGIAVDSTGAAYVTGRASSTETTFPETGGPDLSYNGDPTDAFVAKVAPGGGSLVYAGFIGGNGEDLGSGIAVDSTGAAYVTGTTNATESTFPVAGGPDLTYNGGIWDTFVAKIAPGGTSLTYAGFIGGSGADVVFGIAIDSTGSAVVTGRTDSTEATFPETVGPDLTYNGGVDAFVAGVAPTGTTLTFAGYIGGSSFEIGTGVAVDSTGAAYVTGEAVSTQATFPVIGGPDLTQNGSADVFVAKIAPGGAALIYSGFIGGSQNDTGEGVAVDPTGAAYVTGYTSSSEATFPETVGPDLSFNGGDDVFVAKIAPGGLSLTYAGYIGGSQFELGQGIAVDATGAAYVTGSTSSTEATFPVSGGPDLTHNGSADVFVAKIAPGGVSLTYAGYIGGSGIDAGYGIAVDSAGAAYVTGYTASTETTFPVTEGPDLSSNGGTDAFVAEVGDVKLVSLTGKRKVKKGKVVKLTAMVSPCAGHEGDTIDLYRNDRRIQTVASDADCTVVFRVKMRKTATFEAVSPKQDDDHLEGRSDPRKVKVKKPKR
jgi:hypothetical protein